MYSNAGTLADISEVFMNTQNAGALKDDYALAMGGGLKFESKTLYGFQLGLSGVYVLMLLLLRFCNQIL